MHTFQTQSISIQIPCTYVREVTFPMCLLFQHYIWQRCSGVVVTLVIYVIILKITALLMIFWNVFIHSHTEWSVKCRKVRCLDRRNFWNRTIITIIQKIKYFSIHIWLKIPFSGLYNAHWRIMRTTSWPWKSPEENYFVSIMRMDF